MNRNLTVVRNVQYRDYSDLEVHHSLVGFDFIGVALVHNDSFGLSF
jgi:hypothetical protein